MNAQIIEKWAGVELRYDEGGDCDEVFGIHGLHIERMTSGALWIGVNTGDGQTLHVWVRAKKNGQLKLSISEKPQFGAQP